MIAVLATMLIGVAALGALFSWNGPVNDMFVLARGGCDYNLPASGSGVISDSPSGTDWRYPTETLSLPYGTSLSTLTVSASNTPQIGGSQPAVGRKLFYFKVDDTNVLIANDLASVSDTAYDCKSGTVHTGAAFTSSTGLLNITANQSALSTNFAATIIWTGISLIPLSILGFVVYMFLPKRGGRKSKQRNRTSHNYA